MIFICRNRIKWKLRPPVWKYTWAHFTCKQIWSCPFYRLQCCIYWFACKVNLSCSCAHCYIIKINESKYKYCRGPTKEGDTLPPFPLLTFALTNILLKINRTLVCRSNFLMWLGIKEGSKISRPESLDLNHFHYMKSNWQHKCSWFWKLRQNLF